MVNEIEQVVQALHVLHGQHTPANQRKEADVWLTRLRQSPEAWKVQEDRVLGPHQLGIALLDELQG